MKALAHLAPRPDTTAAFEPRIQSLVEELREQARPRGVAVNALARLPRDPFGRRTPWRSALELAGADADVATLAALVAGLGRRLDDVADLEASTLLVGRDDVVVACGPTPVRYQYLMRRHPDFDHAGYLARYRDVHAAFGVRTPGKRGYVQFHVDPEASRQAAGAAGLGVWDVDSVTELYLDSLDAFLSEVSRWSEGRAAIEDEKVFVDRERSLDFCAGVDWDPGA